MAYYFVAIILIGYANWLLYLPQNNPENFNDGAYNLLFCLTSAVLASYFHTRLNRKTNRRLVAGLLIIVLICFLYEYIAGRQAVFNSVTASLSFALVVVYAFMYFYETLSNISDRNILHDFDFWLISGYLLYFLGNFFIVLAWYKLSQIYEEPLTDEQGFQFTFLWSVHNILLFVSSVITLFASIWLNYLKRSR